MGHQALDTVALLAALLYHWSLQPMGRMLPHWLYPVLLPGVQVLPPPLPSPFPACPPATFSTPFCRVYSSLVPGALPDTQAAEFLTCFHGGQREAP